jgi:PPE-repeat protein
MHFLSNVVDLNVRNPTDPGQQLVKSGIFAQINHWAEAQTVYNVQTAFEAIVNTELVRNESINVRIAEKWIQ